MIVVYSSDSLQAQIVQAICAAHRIDVRVLDARQRLQRHIATLAEKGIRVALFVVELADLQRNGYSVMKLRAELKAAGGRGKVALLFPERIAIDPLIERWASVDQGALLAIPAMNLGLREDSILPVANEIAGALGLAFDSRKTTQFLHGLNPAAFANHSMARLHLEMHRLAKADIRLADMIDWLDLADDLRPESRQQMLVTYEECLLGSDIVRSIAANWGVAEARALEIGNWLLDAGYLYHVSGERRLENDNNLYRLCWPSDRIKAIRLAKALARMSDPEGGVEVTERSYRARRYPACFLGSSAVVWLRSTLGINLTEAVVVGQTLMNIGLIRHVHDDHDFLDSDYFYRFAPLAETKSSTATDRDPVTA